jgi:heterodisulfide reductase subunit B
LRSLPTPDLPSGHSLLPRHYNSSFGAGAGVKTTYPDFAAWIGEERVNETKETGAQALVTACPFCEGNPVDVVQAIPTVFD